jgi:UDP-N-acetyl-D-galactosamine dehydrogenase
MNIAIIGAGYVGLPLAISFSKINKVVCYDINKNRINSLIKGIDINNQHTKKEIQQKKLVFTSKIEDIKDKDYYLVTVPTPIDQFKKPNLSMLIKASLLVGKVMKKKSTIVFESTTYPGCTENICIPNLEKTSRLKFLNDFNVAYSPERVNPGDNINTLKTITKIIGANDAKTLRNVKKLYHQICKSIYTVSSIKIAESAKVIENIQRDINIALVNELSIIFNRLKIPTNEVLKAASTKWNFHYYKPGLVGGHCISVDPYYLAYKASKENYYPSFILSGRKTNERMGSYVANQTVNLLKKINPNVKKFDVAILGFSFKDNIPDIRNTKVIQVINRLRYYNIKFKVFDSIASKEEVKKQHKIKLYNFKNISKFKFDAIILAVSHNEFIQKLKFYDKFFKHKNKKIFIDVKNNFTSYDLTKNKFNFFQL